VSGPAACNVIRTTCAYILQGAADKFLTLKNKQPVQGQGKEMAAREIM